MDTEKKTGFFSRFHNEGFTWHDSLIISSLLVWFIVFGSELISVAITDPLYAMEHKDVDFSTVFLMYFSTIGTWIFCVAYMLITRYNRPIFKALGTKPSGNNLKMLLLGLATGFCTNGVCILIAYLHKDIYLYYDSFNPVKILLLFLAVFIQSSSEELLCRCFHYQRLRKGYKSPWVAIIVNGLIFMSLHLLNPGMNIMSIISIVLIAVLYSLVIYYFDSLWFAMACHTAWNFTQNILFGLPNSGIVSVYSIFKLDASTARSNWIYDAQFGVEGTVLANIVTIVCIVAVILLGRRFGRKELNVWEGFEYPKNKQKDNGNTENVTPGESE